jgi:hypothetical protein
MILTISGFLALVVFLCAGLSIFDDIINPSNYKGGIIWTFCCMLWALLFFCENQELNKLRSSLPTTNKTAIVLESNITSNSIVVKSIEK